MLQRAEGKVWGTSEQPPMRQAGHGDRGCARRVKDDNSCNPHEGGPTRSTPSREGRWGLWEGPAPLPSQAGAPGAGAGRRRGCALRRAGKSGGGRRPSRDRGRGARARAVTLPAAPQGCAAAPPPPTPGERGRAAAPAWPARCCGGRCWCCCWPPAGPLSQVGPQRGGRHLRPRGKGQPGRSAGAAWNAAATCRRRSRESSSPTESAPCLGRQPPQPLGRERGRAGGRTGGGTAGILWSRGLLLPL